MTIDATTEKIEIKLSATPTTPLKCTCSHTDKFRDEKSIPITTHTSVSTNGDTEIVPTISVDGIARVVNYLSINNIDNVDHTVKIYLDISGVNDLLFSCTLNMGFTLEYVKGRGWLIYDAEGLIVRKDELTVYSSRSIRFYKAGTGSDANSYWYSSAKDSGFPGAWSPGTPGVNGRNTDGTDIANDAGCLPWVNASTGNFYLKQLSMVSTSNHYHVWFDCVWVNSGLTVTTTTNQAITTPAFPARDENGSSNGEGYVIGLLFTAAATNAAAISNTTVSYTNSAGTAGRTATLVALAGSQIPATPVVGTIVWFALQAGDTGVRSIEGITLGTSLVTGSISLLVARFVQGLPTVTVNVGTVIKSDVKLYDNTCLLPCYMSSTTAGTVISGQIDLEEK